MAFFDRFNANPTALVQEELLHHLDCRELTFAEHGMLVNLCTEKEESPRRPCW